MTACAQQLIGIEFRNSVLVQQLQKTPAAQAEAAKIGESIRDVTRQARSLARGLSPVQIEANGLMAALDGLTANAAKLFCLACSFECARPVLVENPTVATHLYRVAQEAMGNAIKHAQAKSIVVSDREFEVFESLGEGLSSQQIAKKLHLSAKTVDAHRANIKTKLNIKTTAELISYAARWTSHRAQRE